MKSRKIINLSVFIFLCFFIFSCNKSQINAKNSSIEVNKVYEIAEITNSAEGQITDFTFYNAQNEKVSLSSIVKNKFVFLNFWATWCPPCRAEIPAIIELQSEFMDKDFIVIGIAIERERTVDKQKEKVQNYVTNNKINYMNFVANDELKQKLAEAYGGIQYIPTTFLIDKKGKIIEKIQGGREKKEFKTAIENIMKK